MNTTILAEALCLSDEQTSSYEVAYTDTGISAALPSAEFFFSIGF